MKLNIDKCMVLLYTVQIFLTIHVWYISYMYSMYHMRIVCFSVPYAYGCIVCVYISHSIKLYIGTGGSIPKAYYSKASPKGYSAS